MLSYGGKPRKRRQSKKVEVSALSLPLLKYLFWMNTWKHSTSLILTAVRFHIQIWIHSEALIGNIYRTTCPFVHICMVRCFFEIKQTSLYAHDFSYLYSCHCQVSFLASWHCNGFSFLIHHGGWKKNSSLVAKYGLTVSQYSLNVKQDYLTDVDWRTEWKGPFNCYLFPLLGSKQKSNQRWEIREIVGLQAKYNKQLTMPWE